MDSAILEIIKKHIFQRNWEDIVENFKPIPVTSINGEPVYEFFMNLDDKLEMNIQPVALSVNPIKSFVPYHFHNYVEIIVVLEGKMIIELESEHLHLTRGDIFVAGPQLIHKNREIDDDTFVLNIALKKTAFSTSDLEYLRRSESGGYLTDILFFLSDKQDRGYYTVFHSKDSDGVMITVANIIYEYYEKNDIHSSQIIRHELLVLFAKLLRLAAKSTDNMTSNRQQGLELLSFLQYIEQHYASITLEEMGIHFGFNPSYLSTYLKKHTGKSFIKLVHLQRVNVAADYLLYTEAPIEKISYQIGYENPSYFYRIFKKIMGTSPAEYRQEKQSIKRTKVDS
ncbi:TPA: helix-turn-helix domain-containing protein [Streptococcus suis]